MTSMWQRKYAGYVRAAQRMSREDNNNMRYKALCKVEGLGEKSGADDALCEYPDFPDFSTFSHEDHKAYTREIQQYGRGRAQGLYRLRGKRAKVFAVSFRYGYFAAYDTLKREGEL